MPTPGLCRLDFTQIDLPHASLLIILTMTWDTVITHVKFNAENGKHWSARNRIHLGSVMLTSLINFHDVSAGAIALAEDANALTCKRQTKH